MCTIIEFNKYRGNKEIQCGKQIKIGTQTNRKLKVQELVSGDWLKKYMQNGWNITKMILHIIEQYGYIRCYNRKEYVFEDIRRDVRYSEMHPEVENKRYKAPLWVKIDGEWYFVEMWHDSVNQKAFSNKWIEIGNYDIKGFLIDFRDLKMAELKRMWESRDLIGLVKKLNDYYYEKSFHEVLDESRNNCSVIFGSEKASRKCTYKLVELELWKYAILEGTDMETGSKHMVLMYEKNRAKEYEKYFKEQYGNTGMSLLYKQWKPMERNWKASLDYGKLYKRLVVTD